MKTLIFRVAQLDVWSWLYGPPTKNVAHHCSTEYYRSCIMEKWVPAESPTRATQSHQI